MDSVSINMSIALGSYQCGGSAALVPKGLKLLRGYYLSIFILGRYFFMFAFVEFVQRSVILERVCIIFQNLSGSKIVPDVNLIHLFWLDDLCISPFCC